MKSKLPVLLMNELLKMDDYFILKKISKGFDNGTLLINNKNNNRRIGSR